MKAAQAFRRNDSLGIVFRKKRERMGFWLHFAGNMLYYYQNHREAEIWAFWSSA